MTATLTSRRRRDDLLRRRRSASRTRGVKTNMSRYVLSRAHLAKSEDDLLSRHFWERTKSVLHVVGTVGFLLGCLSFTTLMPYVSHHRWAFFTMSSSVFVMLNIWDMRTLLRNAFSSHKDNESDYYPMSTSPPELRTVLNADVLASFLLMASNLMLLNASILGEARDETMVACKWQFAGSFVFSVVGIAANAMSYDESMADVIETRNVVIFQMLLAATANLIGSILDIRFIACTENEGLRDMLRAWLHALGGSIALFASFIAMFHVSACMVNEEILYGRVKYEERIDWQKSISIESLSDDAPRTTVGWIVAALAGAAISQLNGAWYRLRNRWHNGRYVGDTDYGYLSETSSVPDSEYVPDDVEEFFPPRKRWGRSDKSTQWDAPAEPVEHWSRGYPEYEQDSLQETSDETRRRQRVCHGAGSRQSRTNSLPRIDETHAVPASAGSRSEWSVYDTDVDWHRQDGEDISPTDTDRSDSDMTPTDYEDMSSGRPQERRPPGFRHFPR